MHHTQLLNRLVRERRLVPVAPMAEDVTYHDPCYLGRHNKVYEAPRELVGATGANLREMPRHADRSFCCGAGGARMWMEERIGKQINLERVDEALGTAPNKIATGCPFCRVMMTDGVTDRQSSRRGQRKPRSRRRGPAAAHLRQAQLLNRSSRPATNRPAAITRFRKSAPCPAAVRTRPSPETPN